MSFIVKDAFKSDKSFTLKRVKGMAKGGRLDLVDIYDFDGVEAVVGALLVFGQRDDWDLRHGKVVPRPGQVVGGDPPLHGAGIGVAVAIIGLIAWRGVIEELDGA